MWSSRENILAQLLSLLETTPRQDTALRRSIVWRLGIFGGPEQLPLLRTLLFDVREHFSLRHAALVVGGRHGLHLSGPELTRLLSRDSTLSCDGHDHPGPCHPPLERLLSLVRTEEEDACIAAEAALREASPETRAHLLVKTDCTPLPPRLVEWLFARWYSEDRQLLGGERPWGHDCNLWVAISRAVELLGEWRDARALLYQLLCDFQVKPEVRTALVESLFENDRVAASRWALAALRYPDNAEPVHQVLCLAANAPTPEDRPPVPDGTAGHR